MDLSVREYPPDALSRRFELHRTEDETGISGTGLVAWGVLFPDGKVATRWNSKIAQTCTWDSLEDVMAIHGHGGKTHLIWLDASAMVTSAAFASRR